MDPKVREVREVPDPAERAKAATELLAHYQDGVTELSRIRREAIEEMIKAKLSHAAIAERIGVTRGRIGQLVKTGPSPARAFLGDAILTIVVGEKREEGKGRPVIAQETVIAVNRLVALSSSYQLDTTMESVPPPGVVNLNRDNLVVLAGPRLFPLVGQILDGDPNIRFHCDDDGVWYLRDHREEKDFQSPRDHGEARDFGYLGRLPRPDGRGTFLVCAGVHATGTQGAIAYLENAMPELYDEVRTRRFSALIESTYDPKTLTVTSARLASPIYRHGS